MDLQIQDPLLCDSIALISSIRDLSSRAFELLGELSHASQAAAAALPSPEADGHDEQGENDGDKKEVKEEEGQETQMEVDAAAVAPTTPPTDPHTHALECEFASLYKPLLAKTIRTRQLSRAHLLALQNAKGKIAQRREEVDRLQLELQNSYYRQRYLKKEIELCMDFRSSHLDIDFVPIEEFFADHPEYTMSSDSITAAQSDIEMEDSTPETPAATDPTTTTTTPSPPTATAPRALSEHELIIARLEDECARRRLLEERKKALIGRKSDLTKENSKRKNDLENLDAQLSRFIESATPIQKVLEK